MGRSSYKRLEQRERGYNRLETLRPHWGKNVRHEERGRFFKRFWSTQILQRLN